MPDAQWIHPAFALASGVIAGLAGGWLFYRVWRKIMPRTRSRQFWQHLLESLRSMLGSQEPDDLLRHYRELLAVLARFAGRNTLAVAAGLVPVALAFAILDRLRVPDRLTPFLDQPLRPWLSDLEFWFFLAVIAGSAFAAWSARHRRLATP